MSSQAANRSSGKGRKESTEGLLGWGACGKSQKRRMNKRGFGGDDTRVGFMVDGARELSGWVGL